MIKALFRNKGRPLCALLAIALLIPAMPVAAMAAGHISVSQGIAGYVTTGEAPGTPVAGAAVTVWSTAAVPVVVDATTSDAEGFYEVELPVGDYYVEFEAEGYFGQFYDGATVLVEATEVTVATEEIDLVELYGQDRYLTAIDISQESHPQGARAVVIARGDDFPDALAGASIAGLYNAPILLTRPQSLPAEVVVEIMRLDPSEIFILGGTGAVSNGVATQLAALVGGAGNITRLYGPTRYETAEKIAEHLIAELGEGYNGMAFVATGGLFPDALAASPIMAAQGIPLFLAHPTTGLSASTLAAMSGSVDEATFIVGGTSAVSGEVESDLNDLVGEENVERVAGDDRYETAVAVAEFGVSDFGHMWEGVGIATGERFPDALTGGPYQGQLGSVTLLTRIASLPAETAAALTEHNPHICESVHIYGGVAAVAQTVRNQIMGIITPCPVVVEGIDAVLVPLPVTDAPALTLEKEADVATFDVAGDEIVYTYTLTNTGNVPLVGPFTVVDDKFASPIAVAGAGLALNAEASVTATYTVTAADVTAGSVTNSATARGFYGDTAVASTAAEVTVCMTIAARLTADGRFTTLLAAAGIAGLDDELADPLFSPVTLFAPTDAAFAVLRADLGEVAWDALLADSEALADVLLYHLLTGKVLSADVVAGITDADPDPFLVETLLGADVEFTRVVNGDTVYFVNESELIGFDIEACNGVIHVIDAVLVPAAEVTLEKVASTESTVTVGDEIVYTYTLTNTGPVTLDGPFTVEDDMFVQPIAIDPVMWTELAAGASVEVTASYMVTIADLVAGEVTNNAYAVGWFVGMDIMSATDTVTIPVDAEVDAVVVQHVFSHPHHHMTIDARGTLDTTPTAAPFEPADVCVEFLNTGDAPVTVDVVLDLETTLDAEWWYEATPGVWLDATEGFSLTLQPDVIEEVCFYVYFEYDAGQLAPFDATFNVYADGTTEPVIASTTFEVNLSAPGGP